MIHLMLLLEILLINFRIATNVAVFTLASSPLLRARISTEFPLSDRSTFNLSFATTKFMLKRPSLSSAKYSLAKSSSSFTRFSSL